MNDPNDDFWKRVEELQAHHISSHTNSWRRILIAFVAGVASVGVVIALAVPWL